MCKQASARRATFIFARLLACGAVVACSTNGMGLGVRDAQVDSPSQSSGGNLGLGGNLGAGGGTSTDGSGGRSGTGGATGLGGAMNSGGVTGTGGGVGVGGNLGTGGIAVGGTTGNNCYDSSGQIVASAKTCTSASDCRMQTIYTCCGSDLAIGLARTASCSFAIPVCGDLGCAKNVYPQAEDGRTPELGGSLAVACEQNQCTTYVTSPAGTGGAGAVGGGGAGGAGGSGGTSAGGSTGGRDGSAGDASTGACETDNDCVFRSEAGCCGMCLAVSDPVPPMIPCGRMCFGELNCACVDHHCTEGTLPLNSPCEPEHDLCQGGTKCCAACGPHPLDGSSGCEAPACASATYGSDGVAQCPETA